jgi:hypothetical protein
MLPLVLSACLAILPAELRDGGTAPDGHRGLGGTPLPQLLELMRSRKGEGAAFVEELRSLPAHVRRQLGDLTAHYAAWSAFDLLSTGSKPDVGALHRTYLVLEREPLIPLVRADRRARLFARMFTDLRFRLRARAGQAALEEALELERALAVLRGAAEGFVVLVEPEAAQVAARADLAASKLRALRHDLAVLRPGEAPGEGDAAAAGALLALVSLPEAERREQLAQRAEALSEMAERMGGALFSVRLAPALARLETARADARDRAAQLLREARVYLPDTPEGEEAPPELRKMRRHERIRAAMHRAREGLALDPLDAELAWIAARSADFLHGSIESRPLYDRFLVLRGVRHYDHTTLAKRKLDERETEALSAVQRPLEALPVPEGG